MAWPDATGLGPPDVLRLGCAPLLLEANPDVAAPPEPEAVDCVRLRKNLSQELLQILIVQNHQSPRIHQNELRSLVGVKVPMKATNSGPSITTTCDSRWRVGRRPDLALPDFPLSVCAVEDVGGGRGRQIQPIASLPKQSFAGAFITVDVH